MKTSTATAICGLLPSILLAGIAAAQVAEPLVVKQVRHDLIPLHDATRVLANPHKGWYHHFPANHPDKYRVARDADLLEFPGMNHVYVRLAWSYLEPKEGQFDWAVIDQIIEKWTAHGLGIVFRICCKETSTDRVEQQYATPRWVKEAGAQGGHYRSGEAVAPEGPWEPVWDDPIFLEKLERFLATFAARYRHSHLPSWVDRPNARRGGGDHPLGLLRSGGPLEVAAKLRALPRGSVCIVNAAAPRDIEVFAAATLAAESTGSRFLYRTAAGFVAARIGQSPQQELLAPEAFSLRNAHGGRTVVGSYVPRTTAQLTALLALPDLAAIELSVAALLDDTRRSAVLAASLAEINTALAAGRDTIVSTSRALITSPDATTSLAIGRSVSEALIFLVQHLAVAPRYLIAKGGITSSETATQGLGVRRALVLGQALPGVPVWQLGSEARFPGLGYVVFPGNVGSDTALAELIGKLRLS